MQETHRRCGEKELRPSESHGGAKPSATLLRRLTLELGPSSLKTGGKKLMGTVLNILRSPDPEKVYLQHQENVWVRLLGCWGQSFRNA